MVCNLNTGLAGIVNIQLPEQAGIAPIQVEDMRDNNPYHTAVTDHQLMCCAGLAVNFLPAANNPLGKVLQCFSVGRMGRCWCFPELAYGLPVLLGEIVKWNAIPVAKIHFFEFVDNLQW